MKKTTKFLAVASTLLCASQSASAVTLAIYGFDAGALSATNELFANSSGNLSLGTGWTPDITNGNISILATDVGTNTNLSTASQISFVYTVTGLAAGETLSLDSATFDYTNFDGSARVDVVSGVPFLNETPANGDGSHTSPLTPTGLVNGDMATITFALRDGSSADGLTYTLDNFELEGTITPVPEPSSAALLGISGLALVLRRRRA